MIDREVCLELIESILDEFVRVAASIQKRSLHSGRGVDPRRRSGARTARVRRRCSYRPPVPYGFPDGLFHQLGVSQRPSACVQPRRSRALRAACDSHRQDSVGVDARYVAAESSLPTLLTNAVMAWNTMHMQRAVDQIEVISGLPSGDGPAANRADVFGGDQLARHVRFSDCPICGPGLPQLGGQPES